MPVYHSVVVETDGKSSEQAKIMYATPKIKRKSDRRGRFGPVARGLLIAVFVLLVLFLLALLGQYLYEIFGPKHDPEVNDVHRGMGHGSNNPHISAAVRISLVIATGIIVKCLWNVCGDEQI